ncbi:restriction endonuclease subunit S [Staphylococcus aureus]|nr:restriction endonuclease subunit S [Staphylococcus aureus]
MQPTLRFPEFKDEWSYNLFSNIVTNRSKKFNPSTEEATNDIELDSIEQNTGRLLNTYMSNQFTSQKNIFNKNSVLYSKLRPYLNKYYYSQIDGVCSSEIWVLNTLNKDILSNKFLYYFIQTNRFSSVANKSAGSKMPRADWELVKSIRLYKGSIEEQEKIGDFFSKLDQQIELEEKKLELLEQQKLGYMQKLFSQELRFKDKNGDDYPNWNTSQLGEITKTFSGGTPKSNNSSYYNGDIPFIRSGEISKRITELKITETALNNSSAKLVEKGDLLYALYGATSGEVAISKINGAINQAVLCIKSEESINFLLNFLRLQKQHILKTYIQGGQGNLSASIVKGITIKLPCREEQKKIGKFLDKVGILIEKQSTKIDLLKQRKQGLLQKMFV